MKIITSDTEEILQKAAEHIRAAVERRPSAVLALTCGADAAALYRELSRLNKSWKTDFSQVRVFGVTEYVGAESAVSCRAVLENELLNNMGIPPDNVFFPDDGKTDEFEAKLKAAGGIDLAVLGIGLNGHIGYNEPGVQFSSRTHTQKLTEATKRQLTAGGRKTFDYAVTMGIGTLCEAAEILLLALGEEKADIVFRAVYGRTDSTIPAAFLQLPREVSFYLDTQAAAKL